MFQLERKNVWRIGRNSLWQSEGEENFVLEMSIFIGKISAQKMFIYQLFPGIAMAAPENMCPHFVDSGIFVSHHVPPGICLRAGKCLRKGNDENRPPSRNSSGFSECGNPSDVVTTSIGIYLIFASTFSDLEGCTATKHIRWKPTRQVYIIAKRLITRGPWIDFSNNLIFKNSRT